MSSSFGFIHFWNNGDNFSHFVAIILFIMSILTWYFILSKTWFLFRLQQTASAPLQFWQASSLEQAVHILKHDDRMEIYYPLLEKSLLTIQQFNNHTSITLVQHSAIEAQTTQIIRQQLQKTSQQLEAGQTLLGSVSATAPFIGLLGTVWGIYHALLNLSETNSLQLSQITGPVGEALIMTAFGLAVAIPAVLGFNAFNRTNRIILENLEGFAYDVHAYLTSLQPGRK